MPWIRNAGLFILILAAGCAGRERAPEAEPPWAASQEKAPAPAPAPPPAVKPAPAPVQAAPKPEAPVAVAPPLPLPASPAATPAAPVSRPEAPAEKLAAKVPAPAAPKAPASPAPKEPAPKKASVAPPAPKPAAAPLDLTLLEKRLKETNAIGVFTKLTLKNQVDDLLNQFRTYYQGKARTTLAALRQPYEQLLLKVLSLLQDSDPLLAREITESREAIWGILSDPEKFKGL